MLLLYRQYLSEIGNTCVTVANLLKTLYTKFYQNRPCFIADITKNILAYFFLRHGVVSVSLKIVSCICDLNSRPSKQNTDSSLRPIQFRHKTSVLNISNKITTQCNCIQFHLTTRPFYSVHVNNNKVQPDVCTGWAKILTV